MTGWQVLRQLQFLLKNQDWTGSSTPVFHERSVIIAVGDELSFLSEGLMPPMAIIRPGGAQSDPLHGEEPDLIQQDIDIALVQIVHGDKIGQNVLIGAYRQGQTDSRGRGLLELEEELFNAVEKLTYEDGVVIQNMAVGAALTQVDDRNNVVAFRDYTFQALVTADRFYHPARKFAATGGTGDVDLTWEIPPTRYDRFKIRLVRKAGSSAPATVTDGTEITLPSNLPSSYNDSGLASGTYSYGLWASYDETHDPVSTNERLSERMTQTGIVVA